MRNKRFYHTLLFLLFFYDLSSQVNLQTGSATFSLPMFDWKDDKSRLNSVVALSYNSGNGLKVSEIASNAGQGWNLISGGEIVRIQAGEPDDQVARPGTDYDISKYPSGILYATVPAANGCPEALTKYPIYGWKNQLYAQHNVIAEDKQLDYFSFRFNGKAGMFVLDPSNLGVAKSLGDTKMKITFLEDANLVNSGIRTKITSFTIQDVDGLIYKFTKHALTKVLKTEYSDENYTYRQTQPKFKNGKVFYQAGFEDPSIINPWIIGSWHLTEIEDALTHRKLYFNYVIRNINTNAGEDISYNQTNKNYGIVSKRRSITQTPELVSIVYPDGHLVTVNYGDPRFDVNGAYAISSVDITYQGRFLSRHELRTSYFILNRYGTPVSDYEKKVARLCLRSVRKIGVDLKEDTPPYLFEYFTGSSTSDDIIPPPFSYAKDIWGFYNGDNTKGYWYESFPLTADANTLKNSNYIKGLCFLRDGVSGVYLNAKPGYAKNGLLKQVIYPTGGTLTYQYEQNTGILNGSVTNVGGVHVKQTSSTDGGFSNGCANPIVTNYNYNLNGGNSSLWGLEKPRNSIESHNHYQPEYKSYKWSLDCVPFGCCYWHFQYPGIMSQQQAINLAGWQKAMESLSPVLGIVSILGTINDVATVIGGGSPVSLIIDVIVGIAQVAVTCIGNQARDNSATVYFNTDLNAAAPLPVQFKRVEVVENSGSSGKTIQEFTSDDDYAIWHPDNPVFSAKQRFAPWAYGLPKKTTVLDVNGSKISETTNIYDFVFAKQVLNYCSNHGQPCNPSGLMTSLVSCKCEVQKTSSQRNTKWTDPATFNPAYYTSSNTDMKVDFYGMYTGRVLLSSSSEKIYKVNDPSQAVETKVEYLYNNGDGYSNYEPFTITTYQSNGDMILKHINYSDGAYPGGVLNTLLTNNIITQPVRTFTEIRKAGIAGTIKYLDEKVTEFTQLANGNIVPYRILEQRFDKPASSLTPYAGPTGSISQYKIPQEFFYDGSGNLTGLKDEGGRVITNIYDYDDKYIAASVINADPLLDKAAYTSFETNSFGNWTLSGTTAYSTINTATGNRAFDLSGGKTLSATSLNTAKPHLVSFWSTGSGIIVTGGASLIKSGPTYNGTTYYEYEVPPGASSVTVSGNGTIDELRLYPKTARMRTVTYDPLIGKTSECDENNRITYYEYDNLGRLRFVKDEKMNVVKMNEYNNISLAKQNGCPGVYYNHFISQVYRKQCAAGYLGEEVVYSVPANTYSSALSQEDADAQAEHNLLVNGQAYANANGSCSLIYYNTVRSVTRQTENCPPGSIGGNVTYTVPAGRYWSIISQADADEKAQDDLDANADAYINDPLHAVCISSTDPLWIWLEGAASYCQTVGNESHLFIQETDMNPTSATYLQTRWSDVGPDPSCPQPTCTVNNCNSQGEAFACINGVCEMGIRVNTQNVYHPALDLWECIYHYEFSNGSWSLIHSEFNSAPCNL